MVLPTAQIGVIAHGYGVGLVGGKLVGANQRVQPPPFVIVAFHGVAVQVCGGKGLAETIVVRGSRTVAEDIFGADGISESGPLLLNNVHLFVPVTITLKAAARDSLISAIEARRTGYFEFEYDGVTHRGFIAQNSGAVTVNPMNEKANEFTLLAADVTL